MKTLKIQHEVQYSSELLEHITFYAMNKKISGVPQLNVSGV